MPTTQKFRTVHDLHLSLEEQRLWGGLPQTPETYPRIDGMSPWDSALVHMVLVCLDRRDFTRAKHYAGLITDPAMRYMRLGMIALRERKP